MNNIAGSVLPIKRAEELILTLPGVVSAKIIESESGAVEQIHVLTTAELTPKQVVRNIESALMAHLAMRVDHRKISVAITSEAKPKVTPAHPQAAHPTPRSQFAVGPASEGGVKRYTARRLYFEDVEVRGSRTKGLSCRVTLRKGEESYIGEAHGIGGDRSRLDLAARATVFAIGSAEGREGQLAVEGVKVMEAFDREYVFVGVTVRAGRDSHLLVGNCEIKGSAETASALAVLSATNRWVDQGE
ncbi:MAG TPA: hypothetical protein VK542_08765 [Gemmatimonadaceae bacterium]|nr:hypothetical protein [Gemmatimonadaceae bacterium]